MQKIRRSLELTAEEWQRIDALAEEWHTLAARGPKVRSPSWRILVREIALGNLTITKEPTRE